MRSKTFLIALCGLVAGPWLLAQTPTQPPREMAAPLPPLAAPVIDEGIKALVGRLDLERYKATVKGLTQFGDRRQGTDRNRAAIDWIEAQLKSYGCPTERIKYEYQPPPRTRAAAARSRPRRERRPQGGGRLRGHRRADRREHRSDGAARREASRAEHAADDAGSARGGVTAPRSARPTPRRCTSSAPTWTATAGARPPTTTAPAPRW